MSTRLATLVFAVLCLPAVAVGQSRWQTQVQAQLDRFGNLVTERGYVPTHQIKTGSLRNREDEYFTVDLDGGHEYAMVGVCDEDCSDIDLRLFNEAGFEVDADVKTDDYPVVSVRPSVTARYRVKVVMATCATSPCFYGVGVYGK